jgi:RNA polymerase sigma-70 factor (ECF subfamily)
MAKPIVRHSAGPFSIESASAFPGEELLGLERAGAGTAGLSLEEGLLIDRCLAGDDSAFDQLVTRYQNMVYNLSLRLLGKPEDALDLAQDVFFQVYRKLAGFRRDAALKTWIYRIVVNRAKNRQRWWRRRLSEMRAVPVEEMQDDDSWALGAALSRTGDNGRPDEALERKELGAILQRAMAALPLDQRTILVLKEVEGLSYEEIARTLGLALGTVKSRLARARMALRGQLETEL